MIQLIKVSNNVPVGFGDSVPIMEGENKDKIAYLKKIGRGKDGRVLIDVKVERVGNRIYNLHTLGLKEVI